MGRNRFPLCTTAQLSTSRHSFLWDDMEKSDSGRMTEVEDRRDLEM
jgi:hypothetical protein